MGKFEYDALLALAVCEQESHGAARLDFQSSRFVAVVLRHSVFAIKERPAVDAWNSSMFGQPAFSVKTF
jgi:hypothetical protein